MNMNIAPYNNKYEDDSINYDDSYNYENDIISGNNDLDEDIDEESNNEIINKNIIDNLNMKRSLLMKSNIRMRKENRILEREINNYQKQFLNHKNLYNIYNNIFPKNFHFFKTNLLSSINNNTNILDQIFKSQQINQNIINKIKNIYSRNENIFKKVESINREKAEIQILNEENEKKLNDLKEENELYKDEIQKIKLELIEMKNKNNNLNVLKNSCIKKIQDTEELINNLNDNKNKLEEELDDKTDKMNLNTKMIRQNNKDMNFYKNKIYDLQKYLNNLLFEKKQLTQRNIKIKNDIDNFMNNNYEAYQKNKMR